MKNQNKDQAIESVKDGNKTFYQIALEYSKEWIKQRKESFTSEDIIDSFNANNDTYNEPRVWGAVIATLSKSKLIIPKGWGVYRKRQGHQRPSRIWEVRINFNNNLD